MADSPRHALIISDMMMPHPNGSEVLQILSQYESTLNIPFIFLTELTDERKMVSSLKNWGDTGIGRDPKPTTNLSAQFAAWALRTKST